MGHLAEELGPPFEAIDFLSVAAAESLLRDGARRYLERFSLLPAPVTDTGRGLAELLAADLGTIANRPKERGHAGYKGRNEL
jgi:hypothetical protein